MPRPRLVWSFGYEQIADLCGITENAVAKHCSRGNLIPDDLLSVVCFVTAHGMPEVRHQIFEAMSRQGSYVYPGTRTDVPKKAKAERKKRAAKKKC